MNLKNNSTMCFFIFMLLFINSSYSQPDDNKTELDMSYDKSVVPIIRVIANPDIYDNKEITFTGYYHLETHLTALFSDKDSCLEYSTENSILLDSSLSKKVEYIHCGRLTVKGMLHHTREYYGLKYKSDLYLKNTQFIEE